MLSRHSLAWSALVVSTLVTHARGKCTADPCYAPKEFDCEVRRLALQYSNVTLGPDAELDGVFAALNLSACGDNLPEKHGAAPGQRSAARRVTETEVFVAVNGSDSQGDGSLLHPYATVHFAQQEARRRKAAIVTMMGGTYYLEDALTLTAEDSGTTFRSYVGEKAVLSGGRALVGLEWTESRSSPTPMSHDGAGPVCNMHVTPDTACTRDTYLRKDNVTLGGCCAICMADTGCAGFTLHDNSYCFFSHSEGIGHPSHDDKISCVTKEPFPPPSPGPSPSPSPPPGPTATVYVADLPQGFNESVAVIDELFYVASDGRQMRQWPARYPNGNPALPNDGYTTEGKAFLTATTGAAQLPLNVHVACSRHNELQQVAQGTMLPLTRDFNFTVPCSEIPAAAPATLKYGPLGSQAMYSGGALSRFDPPQSFWNSTVPSGITGLDRASGWKTPPSKWKVHAYHPDSWGNWGFEVSDYDPKQDKMTFARGGNQEARGGGSHMGPKYYAGILEELDDGNEFFYDRAANRLHWAPPSYAQPLSAETMLIVPVLSRVVEAVGASPSASVKGASLEGVTIRHTKPTFCCDHPYESVSGGDWSIHRGGMVFLENTTDVVIRNCLLDSPGGNGIFVNGYNRGLQVVGNEVRNSGDSSIAAVGKAEQMDGRLGLYPRNCTFTHNHLHDWGVWGKQTSAFFAGITRELTLDHNIIYNGPRAGINQNDGFAGGNTFSFNLVFNTVLDTGDHGNFNSWDRKPFLWLMDEADSSSVQMVPQRHSIHNNFIIRTSFLGPSNNLYCIEYKDFDNFLVYGGIKFREGLSKQATNNYLAFANGPDSREVPFADQVRGTNNTFINNTVFSGTDQFYGSCAGYDTSNPAIHVAIDFNSFFSPDGVFSNGGCGGKEMNFKEWQQSGLGQDQHSTLARFKDGPSYEEMIAAGRRLVFP